MRSNMYNLCITFIGKIILKAYLSFSINTLYKLHSILNNILILFPFITYNNL